MFRMADGRSERTLSLLHLRKTFSEYAKVPLGGQKEVDYTRILPLFTKVIIMFSFYFNFTSGYVYVQSYGALS